MFGGMIDWLIQLSKIRAHHAHYLSTQLPDNIILGEN